MAKIFEFPSKKKDAEPKPSYFQESMKVHITRLVSMRTELRAILKDLEKLYHNPAVRLVKNESDDKSAS